MAFELARICQKLKKRYNLIVSVANNYIDQQNVTYVHEVGRVNSVIVFQDEFKSVLHFFPIHQIYEIFFIQLFFKTQIAP